MPGDWVKLKHQDGQFWDSRIEWGIKLDEVKRLPDLIPADSLTAQRIRMGGIIKCQGPDITDQEMFTAQQADVEAPQVPHVDLSFINQKTGPVSPPTKSKRIIKKTATKKTAKKTGNR